MPICVKCVDFASLYDFVNKYLNCWDSVVFFFYFYTKTTILYICMFSTFHINFRLGTYNMKMYLDLLVPVWSHRTYVFYSNSVVKAN
jgi:hypothetical protein